MKKKEPVYWRCGGGSLPYKWGYGYWTGSEKDLLCIKSNIKTNEEAEGFLSPICCSKKEAREAFEKEKR